MAVALDRIYTPDFAAPAERRPGLPFAFTGRAGQYFGIWIVNILLSVVTLGIYSAWAKVRTNRYFYGSTRLDGNAFDYLASPLQILRGRLLMVGFFAAYSLSTSMASSVVWVFILAMVVLTPWAMVKARVFTAHQSSYRNVRFGFDGGLREATKLYILLPIAGFLTLGILLPYIAWRRDRFLIANSRYGQTSMTFGGSAEVYYKAYGIAFLCALPMIALAGALILPVAAAVFGDIMSAALAAQLAAEQGAAAPEAAARYGFDVNAPMSWSVEALPLLLALAAVGLWQFGAAYKTTRLQNYRFSETMIGPHRLRLDLELWTILWIRTSNLLAIAASAGLMIPWARVRMARYQVERMSLIADGDLDVLVGEQRNKAGAYGDEFGEGMDLDLGLGV